MLKSVSGMLCSLLLSLWLLLCMEYRVILNTECTILILRLLLHTLADKLYFVCVMNVMSVAILYDTDILTLSSAKYQVPKRGWN